MDPAKIRSLAQAILTEVDSGTTPPPPPAVDTIVHVQAGASLQVAHDTAVEGSTLVLEPGTYDGALRSSKRLTWQPKTDPAVGRIAPSQATVTLISGGQTLTNTATDAVFRGLAIKSRDSQQTLVMDTGTRLILDRMVILGDPVNGQHRGLCPHGTDCALVNSFVDECWLVGRDACAVGGWDGTNGLYIDNCYLGGGAQSVLFGGADPSSESRTPHTIAIKRSTLSKNARWYQIGAQIKCALELKNAINVMVQDCILDYAGISGGSTGYIILLTPRNQGGTAPYSTVSHVTLERLLCRHGGGGISFLGSDDTHPSGPLQDVVVRNVQFENLDPNGAWKGQGRVFLFNRGPKDVTLDGITAEGANLQAEFYFIKPPVGLKVSNVKMPATKYGVKIDAGGSGWPAVQALAPDTVVTITPTDVGAVGVPVP